ncbi:trypsin-like serine protease [Halorubrum sp. ASP121]|uniref:VWD domain-containing protein n=1 Tax=Halorubrum sp. ASP121 TaxID=1855858 RepID=UPI0010F602B6|nr:VWD domain-containing protein [Halorubrum sp. ASP121]TKX48320.1 trypsin-like serine protease [Halorubrum sp. ASP121]
MTTTREKIRAIFFSILMIMSITSGSIAFGGGIAAANSYNGSVDNSTASTPVINVSESSISPDNVTAGELQTYEVTVTIENTSLNNTDTGEVDLQFDGFVYDDDNLDIDVSADNITNGTVSTSTTVTATAPETAGERRVILTDLRRNTGSNETESLIEDANATVANIVVSDGARDSTSRRTAVELDDLSGDGSQSNPFEISNASELQAIENDLDANYTLVSDINASSTAHWNDGTGFDPIGGLSNEFTGSLDGNGHTITGLTIDRPNSDQVGLFGRINSATLLEISLVDLTVTGDRSVGGVVGDNLGTVRSVTASGSVNGGNDVGGLVGYNGETGVLQNATVSGSVTGDTTGGVVGANYGTIQNTTVSGRVTGTSGTGGLVGYNDDTGRVQDTTVSSDVTGTNFTGGAVGINNGTVQNAMASGSVNGSNLVGGLVGTNVGGIIQNVTASGSVTGDRTVGGLVGAHSEGTITTGVASGSVSGTSGFGDVGGLVGRNSGTIQQTFAVGTVSRGGDVGGLVGDNATFLPGEGTVENSYWDTQATEQSTSAGSATSLTTAQMQGQAAETNMSGLVFRTVWQTQPDDYPTLVASQQDTDDSESQQVDIPPDNLAGDGTHSDPYVITNASELQAMEDNLEANYTLGNDIDASGTVQWNNESGFDPVGDGSNVFTGSLDGSGHKVTNVTINRSDQTFVGLISRNNGRVVNVSLVDFRITGKNYVGGLVGLNEGIIQHVAVSGSVDGSEDVGGLVASNFDGTVQSVTVSGSVNGTGSVGGLAGTSTGTIQNATTSGSVNGTGNVGGLVGLSSGIIQNATTSGSVSGSERVGGFVGKNRGTIQNATTTTNVNGSEQVGGFVGLNGETILDAKASGSVHGIGSVGGFVGRNVAGTIQNTSAGGDVSGTNSTGGLVGFNSGTVQNTSASGNVNGTRDVGGLIGGTNTGTIRETFAVGSVSGERTVGGLIGSQVNSATVKESYFDLQTTGQNSSTETVTGLTTAEMQGQAAETNMSGLEFGTVWQTQSDDYPTLIALQGESNQPERQDAAFTLAPQATTSSTVNTSLGDETRPAVVAENVTSNVDGAIVVVYEVSRGGDRVAGVRETTTTETNGDSVTIPLENTSGLPGPHYAVFLNESTLNSTNPSPGDILSIQAEEKALATQPSLQSSSFYQTIYDGEINVTDQEFIGSTTEITVNQSTLQPDAPSGYVVVLHDQSRAGGTPVGPPIGASQVLNGTQTNLSITLNAGEEINTTRDIVAMLHFAESGSPGQAIPNADEDTGLVAGNVANKLTVTIREDPGLELAVKASNDSVVAGDEVSVTANVTNINESARGEQIEFVVDGNTVETRTVDQSVSKTDYNVSGQRGVALSEDSIYVTEGDTILEIDRATGETVSQFTAPEGAPRGLTYADGSLWFTDTTENNFQGGIVELNPETGEVRSRITNDRYDPTDLAYADGSLWVLEVTLNSVRELDPDTGEQLSQFDVRGALGTTGPSGLSYQNNTLWVGTRDTNELGQFTTDGNLIQRTGKRDTSYRSLASDRAALYGPGTDGNLTVLRQFDDTDPVSGEQTTETFVYQTDESDVPEITAEVVSESANDSVDISVEEPVGPDPTDQLEVTSIQGPTTIGQTQRLSVSATVNNPTSSNVTESVSFVLDTDQDGTPETIDTRELTLASEANTTVGFTAPSSLEAGAYAYGIAAANETQRQLTVVDTEFKTAVSTGDPHIVTFDDFAYDYMAAGEYTLVREPTGSLEIQARQEPVVRSDSVTINTALATTLDGQSVVIDVTDSTPVQIDGTPTPIEDGTTVAVGNGAVERTGDSYVIVYPGENSEPDPSDERVVVDMFSNRIDIEVRLDPDRNTPVEGILGNVDGNSSNDIALANGTVVSNPSDSDALYGSFRDDWRVTNDTTLFSYEGDNGPETYYDPTIPQGSLTVNDLDPETRTEAERLAEEAGLTPGTTTYRNAIIDYALTGDESYFASAQQQNASTDINESVTPERPPELNGSSTLSVTATNASGDIVPGAEIKLYNDSFVILDSRQTNQSGLTSWSTLETGEYNVELYGPEGAFWGGTSVTVGADGASTTVQRTAPRLSRVAIDGDENGEGGFYGGRPVTISPEVQNDGPERPVRVRIQVDTNNNDSAEKDVLRGGFGTNISSGETGFYGYEFDPATNGTKQIEVLTQTYINNNWVVTDSSGWTESFEVENNIVSYDPTNRSYNNTTTVSTSIQFPSSSAKSPNGINNNIKNITVASYAKSKINNTTEYPWSSTGYLTGRGCTATVIEDRHIITAAHCVYNTSADRWVDNIHFVPEPEGDKLKVDVSGIKTYKKFIKNGNVPYDVAVLTLERPIGSNTGTFGYEHNKPNSPVYDSDGLLNPNNVDNVHVTGYPSDRATFVSSFPSKWDVIADGEGTSFISPQILPNFACVGSSKCHEYSSGSLLKNLLYSGQSGGPVWKVRSKSPRIITIHSKGFTIPGFSALYDAAGTRISEKKYRDIGQMIDYGYTQIPASNPNPVLIAPSPPDDKSGSATGDPHLTTYDGVAYDFQAAGEFVLTNDSDGSPHVQARLRPVADRDVSVISAVATQINGTEITIDARDQQMLIVDGTPKSLETGESMTVEDGEIFRTPETYIVVYPGANDEVDDGDSRLEATVAGDRLDVVVKPNRTAVDSMSGLLGSPDGNAGNDIALADGTTLSTSPSFEELYGQYREDYRVTAENSLFDYDEGESPEEFYDPNYPSEQVTVDDLPADDREAAIEAATNAGLEPGTAHFRDAVLDYALTEDPSYIQSASTAADETDVTTDATSAETALTAPELSVETDSGQIVNEERPLNLTVAANHPDPDNVRVVIANGTEPVFDENVSDAFEGERTVSWDTTIDGATVDDGVYTLGVVATSETGVRNVTTRGLLVDNTAPSVTVETSDTTINASSDNATIAFGYNDTASGVDPDSVTVLENGTEVTGSAQINASATRYELTGLKPGESRTVEIRIADEAGLVTNQTVTATVATSDDGDTDENTVTFGGGGGGGSITDETNVDFPIIDVEPTVVEETDIDGRSAAFEETGRVTRVGFDDTVAGSVTVSEFGELPNQTVGTITDRIAGDVTSVNDTSEFDFVTVVDISPSSAVPEQTSATVEIDVPSEQLDDPSSAVIVHWTDDGWEQRETTVQEVSDGTATLSAPVESFSLFAVIEPSSSETTADESSGPESDSTESGETQTSEPSETDETSTTTEPSGSSTPTLPILLALVAVVGAALAVLRRRDRL